jgi:dihydroxyacetone kinase-like protein
MKKLINDPSKVVNEMVDGIATAYPDCIHRLGDAATVVRAETPIDGKVGVISGGGSGHEPAHAGYVGMGMLDGAAAGEVFTSPTADQISELIQECDTGEGVLAVVKNYEGDVMSFETAGEMVEIESDTVVESVVVDDDVAVEDSEHTSGRRGICGTVLVHKVAGAMAERGADLDEVTRVAQKTVDDVASMGIALGSCTPPEKGSPTFKLDDDEIELGIGIHGEPGIERIEMTSASDVASRLVDATLDDLGINADDEVAVIVNGMGGTPLSELYVVHDAVSDALDAANVDVWQTWVGEYMTSLEMEGCSVTLLRLDDELKDLLADPVNVPTFDSA